jgi:hypothetical protein
MVTAELTGKVTELKELKKLSEELAAEIAAIEDAIKAEMTARDVEKMSAGVYMTAKMLVGVEGFEPTTSSV